MNENLPEIEMEVKYQGEVINEGKPGKSAYEYAKEGGYTGTEEEFAAKLAFEPDWVATKEEKGGTTVVIAEQTLSSGMWKNRQYDIIPGIKYVVYINGVPYICEARNVEDGIVLGNNTAMNENSYPFCVYFAGGGAVNGLFFKDSTLTYPLTLKVTNCEVALVKMPQEYLPDCVVKSVNGVSPDANGNVEVKGGVDSEELTAAVESALAEAKESGEFDGESIGVEDYDADDDYTTVVFTNGDVIRIPSGAGIKNIRLSEKSDTGNTYEIELTNGQSYEFVAPAGPAGKAGAEGKDGEDGYSPSASVTQNATGVKIIVTDKDGTTEATVENGTATDEQVAAWLDAHPEATTTVQDGSVTMEKLSEDVLNAIESSGGGGLSQSAKDALLNCFRHVAWIDENGATYLSNLETALNSSGGSTAGTVESISAVYSGGSVGEGSDLSELRKNLVVTATYSDGTESIVSAYTLSGTIGEGINTITVTYRKVTTTFTVEGIPSYNVTNNLTGVTNSNAQTSITEGFYSATLTVEDRFMLNSVVITMGGVDVTDSVYTADTGSILITEVTGDIVITAVASEPQYVGMRTHLYHDTVSLYSSADTTTKLTTKNYISGGALSLCRTESDVNVIIRLTNNTDNDVSGTSYAGCVGGYIGNTSQTAAYNAVLGTSATVRAGQTVEYTYTLKAGYYLYVFANNELEVSVVGVLDIHEPVAEYELTTGYADVWNAYSDDTTDNKLGGGYYVTFTVTTEVFEEDTNLRITLVNGGTNTGYIGSAKQNAPTTLFYARGSMAAPESGGMSVIHYTVKAGHILSMGMNNIGYVYVEKA